jgi:hypothetical protein
MTTPLFVCEQASGRVVSLDTQSQRVGESVWQPRTDPLIDPADHPWFDYLSDARPTGAGETLLVTASGGAVAGVAIATGSVVWYGYVGGNPHALEGLPDGSLVAASSTGNTLTHFARPAASGRATLAVREAIPFRDAHAVRFDPERSLLWALGGEALRAYGVGGTSLGLAFELPLPSPAGYPGGHDVTFVPGSAAMLVSVDAGVWSFDRDAHTFAPFVPLASEREVKSLTPDGSGGFVFVRADEVWWSDTVRSTAGATWILPGGRIYKARAG